MPKCDLTEAADTDLTEIYTYTFNQFGENQADSYFESLEGCFLRLADNPQLGVDVGSLREGYRRFAHKRHTIYYQPQRDGILVVRILGPGMSPERNVP